MRAALACVAGLVLVNLLWRGVRMWLDMPLWGDEAMLAINFQLRGFAGLAEPLIWKQLAPPGFLWMTEGVTRLLGDAEWSLRLWPALAGSAAMVLFAIMAWRHLPLRTAVLATAVMAASYFPMRHSTEVKPYSTDLLAGVILLCLALEIVRSLHRAGSATRCWVAWGAAGVLLVWLSFPAILVAAGTGLALAWMSLRDVGRDPQGGERDAASGQGLGGIVNGEVVRRLLPGAVAGGAVLLSFAGMYAVYGQVREAETEVYLEMEHWRGAFPPLSEPWLLPWWLIEVHTGRMLAYPVGGPNFGSIPPLLLALLGAAALWRTRRRRWLLGLLLAPVMMGMLAATAGAYPYGTTARTMLYMAPSAVILIAVGLSWLLGQATRRGWFRAGRATAGAVAVLMVIALVGVVRDVREPYKTRVDPVTRGAVEEWAAEAGPGDLWVFPHATRWRGRDGEWYLLAEVGGPVLQYYVHRLAPGEVWYGPGPEAVAQAEGRFRRILIVGHDSPEDPPLEETFRPWVEALRAVRGEPEQREYPLARDATLRAAVFGGR